MVQERNGFKSKRGGAQVRSESGEGGPIRRKAPEIFWGVVLVPLHFSALKAHTISCFGECFRDGQ